LPWARSLPEEAAILAFWAFAFAMTNPALLTFVGLLSREDNKNLVAGAAESTTGLARILGNLLSGALISTLGHGAPFAAGALATACAVYLAWSNRASFKHVAS
jgi:predicted MFS family arabinose efflux permease